MMGMDFSNSAASADTNIGDTSNAAPDLSSLGGFNLGSFGSSDGTGDGSDMFGSGTGGLDLSIFDFSSLTGGTGDTGAGGSGGVDFSCFLSNLTTNAGGEEEKKDNV